MPGINLFHRFHIFFDVVWASLLYGGSIDDYFLYDFYYRSHASRRRFNVWRKRRRIINICNQKEGRIIFNSKALFNETFAAFVNRDWLNTRECSFAEFAAFASKHQQFFVKPVIGSFGTGTGIVDTAEQDLAALFAQLVKEDLLVEEIIRQHSSMAEFHPPSVNGLRIMSLLEADGTVGIKTATFRCGNEGRCADNLFQMGIASAVDIKTGIVMTTGVDIKSRRYIRHPITGKVIIGFQIPFWEDVLAAVTATAQVVPIIRYVGWDVAVGEDGRIILIEGNCAADADLTEMPDRLGKWPLYRDKVKAIAALAKQRKKEGRRIDGKDKSTLYEKGDQTASGN